MSTWVPEYTCVKCDEAFDDEGRHGLFKDELDFFTTSEWHQCEECDQIHCPVCSNGGSMCPHCDE